MCAWLVVAMLNVGSVVYGCIRLLMNDNNNTEPSSFTEMSFK